MKSNKEYNNIMDNLSWCIENNEKSFSTMLANALRTCNPLFVDWMKKVTGKRNIYVGNDWLELSEKCRQAIINNYNNA